MPKLVQHWRKSTWKIEFLEDKVFDMTSAVVIEMTVTSDCAVLSFLENTLRYH